MKDETLTAIRKQILAVIQKGSKTLNLSHQKYGGPLDEVLTYLPEELFEFDSLQVLKVRGHYLSNIPGQISNVRDLTTLDLAYNRFKIFPESVQSLSKLTSLNLSGNRLENIPVWLLDLPYLRRLRISGTESDEKLAWMGYLTNLTELGLSEFGFPHIPDWISGLENLKVLSILFSYIKELPAWFSKLLKLEELGLASNRLSIWPQAVEQLPKLSTLWLLDNQLSIIPDTVENLARLKVLGLGRNYLSSLPDSIAKLTDLRELHLEHNRFSSIPKCVFQLPKLSKLNMESNLITRISSSILGLPAATRLSLTDNPLEDPPIEVVNRGVDAIKDYYRQVETLGVDQLYEAKLLILGEGGAGKTTLTQKILNINYCLREEDTTKGIEVAQWTFPMSDGRDFRVNIWDFGGQEIYHATHQFFLTKRSLYALVADMRKENTDFNYWLQIVELLSDSSPVLLIKNEKHGRQPEINERMLRGQFNNIKEVLATDLATNRGLPEILKTIQFYIEQLPHVGAALPKTWVRVRQALEQEKRNYISLEQYLDICSQYGFTVEKDMLQLSGYLHDLGVFLHFQDDPVLRNTVILNPKWGTDAVYRVLDDELVRKSQGTFTRTDLDAIWSEPEYARKQHDLLQLMKNFHLCYQVPHTRDTYIAPNLLSANQPNYEWDPADNLHLRYVYEFLPKGIMTQFIVAMHEHIREHNCVWKSGVVLEKDGALAEVVEFYNNKEIQVRVTGRNKKSLLDIVDYELEEIHKTYRQLKYDIFIPCNCEVCRQQSEPQFYRLKVLKKFINDRQPKILCYKSYQMVDVRGLIFDVLEWRRSEEERMGLESGINISGSNVYIQQVGQADQVNAGSIEHINTSGGAVVKGNVQTSGDFVGRDQLTPQSIFANLRQKVALLEDVETCEEIKETLNKLEKESAKGDAASENRVKGYFSFLAEMAPDIWEVAVNTFINPIAGVSTVFQKVARKSKGDSEKRA